MGVLLQVPRPAGVVVQVPVRRKDSTSTRVSFLTSKRPTDYYQALGRFVYLVTSQIHKCLGSVHQHREFIPLARLNTTRRGGRASACKTGCLA